MISEVAFAVGLATVSSALALDPSIPHALKPLPNRPRFVLDPGVDQNTNDYYLGYRGQDYNTPWAKFYNDTPITLSPEFSKGLAASPQPAANHIPISQGGAQLAKPGYLAMEDGFAFGSDNTMMLAIRTDQPASFTGEQFDFWFSWHINDTTKYKLWNPGQHQYAAVEKSTIAGENAFMSYRDRYWDKTSFVDEYIGNTAYQLSIGFFDPRLMNFTLESTKTGTETIITGFVQLFSYSEEHPNQMAKNGFSPFDVVLAHQVRRKPNGQGKEIRSRFWFGSALTGGLMTIGQANQMAHDLSVHCFNEMSHVGTFLPQLFPQFRFDVPTGN